MMEESLFPPLGQIFFGGIIAAAVAFAIFRWLGKEWIESKFAERIAIMAHENSVLVRKLKLELEAMLAANKLEERDLITLPGTWARLEKAYGLVKVSIKPGGYMTDVQQMSIFELDELMGAMDWFQAEINRVKSLNGAQRQQEFDQIRRVYLLRRVKEACREFDEYLGSNAIFYPKEMLDELKSLGNTLQSAIKEDNAHEASPAERKVEVKPQLIDEPFEKTHSCHGRLDPEEAGKPSSQA